MNIGDNVHNDIKLMDMDLNSVVLVELNNNTLLSIRIPTWHNMQCNSYFSSNDIIL